MNREFMAIIKRMLNDVSNKERIIRDSKSNIDEHRERIAWLEETIKSDQESISILNSIAGGTWAISGNLNQAVLFEGSVYFYMGSRLVRVSKSAWYSEVKNRDQYVLIEVAGENE